MTSSDTAAAAAAADRPDEQDSEPSARLAAVRQVASRFTGTYGLTQVDPEFCLLFAETVSLLGKEFAGAMLRMLRATAGLGGTTPTASGPSTSTTTASLWPPPLRANWRTAPRCASHVASR